MHKIYHNSIAAEHKSEEQNKSKYKHIDDFIKIPQLNNNDRLFHYTSAAGIKGITGGEFWVTERHFLNDSTEFSFGTDICMVIMDKHMS